MERRHKWEPGERADSGKISSVAAGIVDGVNIKPDTWYTCRDGKLKEVGK